MGLDLLCAFVENTPPGEVPAAVLGSLQRTLASLGTLRLYPEKAGSERAGAASVAERELDLVAMDPAPVPSAPPELCQSVKTSGPVRPLEVRRLRRARE